MEIEIFITIIREIIILNLFPKIMKIMEVRLIKKLKKLLQRNFAGVEINLDLNFDLKKEKEKI